MGQDIKFSTELKVNYKIPEFVYKIELLNLIVRYTLEDKNLNMIKFIEVFKILTTRFIKRSEKIPSEPEFVNQNNFEEILRKNRVVFEQVYKRLDEEIKIYKEHGELQ